MSKKLPNNLNSNCNIPPTHGIHSVSHETFCVVLSLLGSVLSAPFHISYPFPYLLLFDAFIDLGCGLLVGPKQTDDTSPLWVQDVPILIPNHLVKLQDPVVGSGRGEDWGD